MVFEDNSSALSGVKYEVQTWRKIYLLLLAKRTKHRLSNARSKEMFQAAWANVWQSSNFIKFETVKCVVAKHFLFSQGFNLFEYDNKIDFWKRLKEDEIPVILNEALSFQVAHHVFVTNISIHFEDGIASNKIYLSNGEVRLKFKLRTSTPVENIVCRSWKVFRVHYPFYSHTWLACTFSL